MINIIGDADKQSVADPKDRTCASRLATTGAVSDRLL